MSARRAVSALCHDVVNAGTACVFLIVVFTVTSSLL
jgi:hypothetical protein